MYAELKEKSKVTPNENKEKQLSRQIRVHEAGEAILLPDRVRCTITCTNIKETVSQVKDSVSRRIDYITQTLRNNRLKEDQYQTHQLISPTDNGQYKMTAEVVVEFYDVTTFEKTCNWLVEKLENSIQISDPMFYHSCGKLSDLRRKASLNALHNCRSKALAMAQLLNQTLGSPILIEEEEIKEYDGGMIQGDEDECTHSIQQKIEKSTVTVCVKILAVFECSERTKKKPT